MYVILERDLSVRPSHPWPQVRDVVAVGLRRKGGCTDVEFIVALIAAGITLLMTVLFCPATVKVLSLFLTQSDIVKYNSLLNCILPWAVLLVFSLFFFALAHNVLMVQGLRRAFQEIFLP